MYVDVYEVTVIAGVLMCGSLKACDICSTSLLFFFYMKASDCRKRKDKEIMVPDEQNLPY